MQLVYPKAFRRGNIHRAQKVLKSKSVRLAFLGSSCSHFPDEFEHMLSEHLPTATEFAVKYFAKQTLTSAGACFLLNELMTWKPDLVFLDFSLTDRQEYLYEETYEFIIRTILKSGAAVAVTLFSHENGSSGAGHQRYLATYYHLPVLDLGAAIQSDISENKYCWEDIYTSDCMMTAKGQTVMMDYLLTFLDMIQNVINDESYILPEKPCFRGCLTKFQSIDISFPQKQKRTPPYTKKMFNIDYYTYNTIH